MTYLVRVPISGVDATVLVVKLDSAGDGLGQGEAAGGGDGPGQLLPQGLGYVLGHQGVLGLDLWEGVGHVGQLSEMKMYLYNNYYLKCSTKIVQLMMVSCCC